MKLRLRPVKRYKSPKAQNQACLASKKYVRLKLKVLTSHEVTLGSK